MANFNHKATQNKWTPQEQSFIKNMHEHQQIKSWKLISEALNEHYRNTEGSGPKNSKQCRDRYVNYIKYQGCKNESSIWSQSENSILFEKYAQIGSKWTLIAICLGNKSENSIKNKFYNCLRKFVRKLNYNIKENKSVRRKALKYDTVVKILEFVNFFPSPASQATLELMKKSQQYAQLRLKIIGALHSFEEERLEEAEMVQLIKQIYKFGKETKFIGSCKKQKGKKSVSSWRMGNQKQILVEGGQNISRASLPSEINFQLQGDQQKSQRSSSAMENQTISKVFGHELHMIDEGNAGLFRNPSDIWEEELSEMFNSFTHPQFG